MAQRQPWQHIRQLVNKGANLDINGGDHHFRIASLYLDERQVCMFDCGGMEFDAIMDHIDELDRRFEEEGVVTDEINGEEYSVWQSQLAANCS